MKPLKVVTRTDVDPALTDLIVWSQMSLEKQAPTNYTLNDQVTIIINVLKEKHRVLCR